LLWWHGDTLCYPGPGLPVLPSVTARRVLRQARAEGFAVVAERCRPSALRGAEVWSVNALHGVRPVTRWVGAGPDGAGPPRGGPRPVDAERLARYRAGHPSHASRPGRPSHATDRPTVPHAAPNAR
jgi:branched-subunit amino acid aminotransferase/4-amino-4-deoxychorismate lyase